MVNLIIGRTDVDALQVFADLCRWRKAERDWRDSSSPLLKRFPRGGGGMIKVRVAFWNVENCFHWQLRHNRGPKTRQEYLAKTKAVSGIIARLFGNQPPDVLGLAEVGSKLVAEDIAWKLGRNYSLIFAGGGSDSATGLAFIYRRSSLVPTSISQYPSPATLARTEHPRYLNIRGRLPSANLDILFSLNHWKSNLGDQSRNFRDRIKTARDLGDELLNAFSFVSLPTILMGDFNVNPYDRVFDNQRLRGRRSFSTIDDWNNATATFYNPCWRFLAPPDRWSVGRRLGHQDRRPQTSISDGDNIYDQMLFSKSFLINGQISFCDSSVRYYHSRGFRRYTANGRLSPKRWPNPWSPGARGVSDHFPICGTFSVSR